MAAAKEVEAKEVEAAEECAADEKVGAVGEAEGKAEGAAHQRDCWLQGERPERPELWGAMDRPL